MAKDIKLRLLDAPAMNSRIKSANVQKSEKWLGYFAGPAIIMCMYYMCGQSYLNTFSAHRCKMCSDSSARRYRTYS